MDIKAPISSPGTTHHEVFRRAGVFAAWPANYGLWSWGHEVLVVFAVGRMGAKGEIHELDRGHPFTPCQARSHNGGRTWSIEEFKGLLPGGTSLSADEHLDDALQIRPRIDARVDLIALELPIDFLDPETILMCARTGLAEGSVSWFYVSESRGRQWNGPYAFSGLGLPVAARTDVVPLGNHDALFMLTTSKGDGTEGRPFCARTRDGGRLFEFVNFIGEEPDGYRIMPSSAMLNDGTIVTTTRCYGKISGKGWIEVFASDDQGASWRSMGVGVENTGEEGNPPAVVKYGDRGLVLAYGFRDRPFGIRMRTSGDGGRTWSDEFVLRDDGGTPDLGYPRIVPISDRGILVVYYFNDGAQRERYIAATLFDLPQPPE